MVTIENIEQIKAVSIQEVIKDPELTRLVLQTYVWLFDCKNPMFCTRSITNYYNEILKNGVKNLTLKTMERKYILKPDVLIWDAVTNEHYNATTITDEIAENMIRVSPRMANQFEQIPSGKVLKEEEKTIKAEIIEIPKVKKSRKSKK